MKKNKIITSLSSLATLSVVAPVMITGCNDKDNKPTINMDISGTNCEYTVRDHTEYLVVRSNANEARINFSLSNNVKNPKFSVSSTSGISLMVVAHEGVNNSYTIMIPPETIQKLVSFARIGDQITISEDDNKVQPKTLTILAGITTLEMVNNSANVNYESLLEPNNIIYDKGLLGPVEGVFYLTLSSLPTAALGQEVNFTVTDVETNTIYEGVTATLVDNAANPQVKITLSTSLRNNFNGDILKVSCGNSSRLVVKSFVFKLLVINGEEESATITMSPIGIDCWYNNYLDRNCLFLKTMPEQDPIILFSLSHDVDAEFINPVIGELELAITKVQEQENTYQMTIPKGVTSLIVEQGKQGQQLSIIEKNNKVKALNFTILDVITWTNVIGDSDNGRVIVNALENPCTFTYYNASANSSGVAYLSSFPVPAEGATSFSFTLERLDKKPVQHISLSSSKTNKSVTISFNMACTAENETIYVIRCDNASLYVEPFYFRLFINGSR